MDSTTSERNRGARRLLIGILLAFSLCYSTAQPVAAAETRAAEDARRIVTDLTGPDFLGRSALTGDDLLAAGYVLERLSGLGLHPAGDLGGYLQRLTLVQERPDTAAAELSVAGRPAAYGVDYAFSAAPAPIDTVAHVLSLTVGTPADASAFVESQAERIRNAVVLVETELEAPSAYVPALSEAGAVAVLTVRDVRDRAPVWRTRTEVRTFLSDLNLTSVATGEVTPRFAEALRQAGDVTLHLPLETRSVRAANVLARLPGTDPKAPALLIGAHLDHLGVIEGETYPGADDNASGVAAVLLAAEALSRSAQQPAGDVIFAFWTAEERGALGSAYFVTQPTVPLGRLRGYVNLDMIGRNTTAPDIDDLMVLGHEIPAGVDALREVLTNGLDAYPDNSLKLEVDAMLGQHGLAEMSGVLEVGDQRIDLCPTFYLSTDTVSFLQAGVPTLSLSSGMHADYHSPGDSAEKLSYGKIGKVVGMLVELAMLRD